MANSSAERETFIVQNITLGWHSVSDIGLTFAPTEVKDLTWEDENVIKRSRNLKDSIRNGILRKLSEAEYEKTMEMQYQKEKKQLMREQQQKENFRKLKTDDKILDVDTIDLEKGKRKSGELDISGTASHPMSYVTAYEIASRYHEDQGEVLTAEEFAHIVESDPGIVPKLLAQRTASNNQKTSNAYYTVPANDSANHTGVVKAQMTSLNKEAKDMSDVTLEDVTMKANLLRDIVGFDDFDDDGELGIKDAVDFDVDINSDDMDFAEEIIIDDEK